MDTIFALSSGALPSGVAIVRISGPLALDAFPLFRTAVPSARVAQLVNLLDPNDDSVLDRCLALRFDGPASFTGEDVVEFQLHGSRAVASRVLSILGAQPGWRPAEAGEFTRQSFENGKMDLTAVEGLGDLLAAETEQQRRYAVEQSDGRLGRSLDQLRDEVLQTLAVLEASLEFADEDDVPDDGLAVIEAQLQSIQSRIDAILKTFEVGRIVRDGYRVALVGRPNVGKSSLLNAMSGSERAIVTDEAGTTRDLIEVEMDISGFLVRLTDTAGIREAESLAEQEGVRRSLKAANEADLVLSLRCAEIAPIEHEHPKQLAVWTKADQRGPDAASGASLDATISASDGTSVTKVLELIGAELNRLPISSAAVINRGRHRSALYEAKGALLVSSEPGLEHDIRAEHLRLCALAIGRITGRVALEEILDRVFQGFCIGK